MTTVTWKDSKGGTQRMEAGNKKDVETFTKKLEDLGVEFEVKTDGSEAAAKSADAPKRAGSRKGK